MERKHNTYKSASSIKILLIQNDRVFVYLPKKYTTYKMLFKVVYRVLKYLIVENGLKMFTDLVKDIIKRLFQ